MNLVKKSFVIASIGGISFLVGRILIHNAGFDFVSASNATDWLFRIVLIGFVSVSIIYVKKINNGYIGFKDGFVAGGCATLFLSLFVSLGTWVFCNYINPVYVENVENSYREMQYNSTMKKYAYEVWKKDTITQGAIDTVNNSLDKFISNSKFYFTNNGQVIVNLFYSFLYGIVITLTVSLLLVKQKEDRIL
jgi:hypothetical protein